MPSLRRTLSSPAVRCSPYSHPQYPSSNTRQGGGHPRRASGSDIAERRVLADLDWWRIEEGQHELRGHLPPPPQLPSPSDTEEEQEQFPDHSPPSPPSRDMNVNAGSFSFTLPGATSSALESSDFSHIHYFLGMHYESFGSSSHEPIPTFSTLSHKSSARPRLSISSASSQSSVESSPESSPLPLSPMEDMGFADVIPHIADDDLYAALSFSKKRAPALGVRSLSYSFVEDELSKGYDQAFDDPSPAFPSFPTSSPDCEDLFY